MMLLDNRLSFNFNWVLENTFCTFQIYHLAVFFQVVELAEPVGTDGKNINSIPLKYHQSFVLSFLMIISSAWSGIIAHILYSFSIKRAGAHSAFLSFYRSFRWSHPLPDNRSFGLRKTLMATWWNRSKVPVCNDFLPLIAHLFSNPILKFYIYLPWINKLQYW